MSGEALSAGEQAELRQLRRDFETCTDALDEMFEPLLTRVYRAARRCIARVGFTERHRKAGRRLTVITAAVMLLAVAFFGTWCAVRDGGRMPHAYLNQPPVRALTAADTADELPARSGLNVNTATAQELTALPGIGKVIAGRIVTEREEHGDFHYPSDLLCVNGIGPKVLERILPLIVFEGDD